MVKKREAPTPCQIMSQPNFLHQFAIPRLISVFENANAMTNSKLNTFMILSKNKELDEFGRKEKTMVWRKKIDRSFQIELERGVGLDGSMAKRNKKKVKPF